MEILTQLIYTSERSPECDRSGIDNILSASQHNNEKKGITGILVYSKNRFFQYLEGDIAHVEDVYKNIIEDTRHQNINLRQLQPVSQRLFPNWEMKYVDLENHSNLKDSEKNTYENDVALIEMMLFGKGRLLSPQLEQIQNHFLAYHS